MPGPTQHKDLPQRIGAYRVLERIGIGGMATVFRVSDEQGQIFALKLLNLQPKGDVRWGTRFQREFRLLSRLRHPHLIAVHDYGEDHDYPYYVMDYVKGSDLWRFYREKLAGRQMVERLRLLLPLTAQIVSALDYIHRNRVIHQDLKPGNVLLAKSTHRARLVDFGIARDLQDPTQLTRPGFAGTLGYSPPEMLEEGRLDGRADLYSLGVILYTFFADRRPILTEGRSIDQLIQAVLYEEPPSLLRIAPDLPRELSQMIHRLIRKDPAERYSSARNLWADLLPCVNQYNRASPPEGGGGAMQLPLVGISRARGVTSSGVLLESGIIGREKELHRLEGLLQGLDKRQGAALLLHGVAGVGKSFLLDEFNRRVRKVTPHVFSARHRPTDPPYSALSAILTRLIQAVTLPPLGQGAMEALSRYFPGMDALLEVKAAKKPLRPEAVEELHQVVCRLVRSAVEDEAQVWLLDDLQHADEGTHQLLQRLIRELVVEGAPLLLVAVATTSEKAPPPWPPPPYHKRVISQVLPPLSPREEESYITRLLGRAPTAEEATKIRSLSSGIPLRTLEILHQGVLVSHREERSSSATQVSSLRASSSEPTSVQTPTAPFTLPPAASLPPPEQSSPQQPSPEQSSPQQPSPEQSSPQQPSPEQAPPEEKTPASSLENDAAQLHPDSPPSSTEITVPRRLLTEETTLSPPPKPPEEAALSSPALPGEVAASSSASFSRISPPPAASPSPASSEASFCRAEGFQSVPLVEAGGIQGSPEASQEEVLPLREEDLFEENLFWEYDDLFEAISPDLQNLVETINTSEEGATVEGKGVLEEKGALEEEGALEEGATVEGEGGWEEVTQKRFQPPGEAALSASAPSREKTSLSTPAPFASSDGPTDVLEADTQLVSLLLALAGGASSLSRGDESPSLSQERAREASDFLEGEVPSSSSVEGDPLLLLSERRKDLEALASSSEEVLLPLLKRRLDLLGEARRSQLARAAFLAEEFTLDELLDVTESSEEEALDLLNAALAMRLLEVRSRGADERFSFLHKFLRQWLRCEIREDCWDEISLIAARAMAQFRLKRHREDNAPLLALRFSDGQEPSQAIPWQLRSVAQALDRGSVELVEQSLFRLRLLVEGWARRGEGAALQQAALQRLEEQWPETDPLFALRRHLLYAGILHWSGEQERAARERWEALKLRNQIAQEQQKGKADWWLDYPTLQQLERFAEGFS